MLYPRRRQGEEIPVSYGHSSPRRVTTLVFRVRNKFHAIELGTNLLFVKTQIKNPAPQPGHQLSHDIVFGAAATNPKYTVYGNLQLDSD